MAELSRSELWNALKEAGVQMDGHYRDYSTEDLRAAYAKLTVEEPAPAAQAPAPQQQVNTPSIPVSREGAEYAGMTSSTHSDEEPIRVDPDTGFIWYRDEIRRPAYPKPRARRVLKYVDSGSRQVTITNGQYQESFEIPGEENRVAEARITLPSYQVGLYKDPRYPFRIHTYGGNSGFDLFEVEKFYGGEELVPASVRRIYVDNVLCYDMRSVIQAIETEYRERVLGKQSL